MNSLHSELSNSPDFVEVKPSRFQKPCQTNKPHFVKNSPYLNSGTVNAFSTVPKLPTQLNLKGRLTVYENLLFYEHPLQPIGYGIPPERVENDILSFSQKSRQRFFEFFASLNYSKYGNPVFVSCTYHFDTPDNRKDLKIFLKKYYQNLKNCLPDFHMIWKLEYQKRGIPHFHFGFFPLDININFSEKQYEFRFLSHWLNLKACKCIACYNHHTDVRPIENYKHALIYIAKEFCKLQHRYEDHNLGRVWGHSNKMRQQHLYEFDCTIADYHKFIDVKLKEEFKKESTKLYIQGLKYLESNSSCFINWKDVLHLIKDCTEKDVPDFLQSKKYKLKYLSNKH